MKRRAKPAADLAITRRQAEIVLALIEAARTIRALSPNLAAAARLDSRIAEDAEQVEKSLKTKMAQ